MKTYAAALDIDLVFHALSDKTRRRLLDMLSAGPASISKLAAPLEISLAAVVQHVQILEDSGLITTQKSGRVRTCEIDAAGLSAVENWARERRTLWERRFDRLGDLLEEDGGD